MKKLALLASSGVTAVVIASAAAAPVLACAKPHGGSHTPSHSSHKPCPPKKQKHKPCPPKHEKPPVTPPKQEAPPTKPAPKQVTPASQQPTVLPNTGAGAVIPAAGGIGSLGYIGNLIRLKRKTLR
jgi:outer membrane biosynthesis protein TonB